MIGFHLGRVSNPSQHDLIFEELQNTTSVPFFSVLDEKKDSNSILSILFQGRKPTLYEIHLFSSYFRLSISEIVNSPEWEEFLNNFQSIFNEFVSSFFAQMHISDYPKNSFVSDYFYYFYFLDKKQNQLLINSMIPKWAKKQNCSIWMWFYKMGEFVYDLYISLQYKPLRNQLFLLDHRIINSNEVVTTTTMLRKENYFIREEESFRIELKKLFIQLSTMKAIYVWPPFPFPCEFFDCFSTIHKVNFQQRTNKEPWYIDYLIANLLFRLKEEKKLIIFPDNKQLTDRIEKCIKFQQKRNLLSLFTYHVKSSILSAQICLINDFLDVPVSLRWTNGIPLIKYNLQVEQEGRWFELHESFKKDLTLSKELLDEWKKYVSGQDIHFSKNGKNPEFYLNCINFSTQLKIYNCFNQTWKYSIWNINQIEIYIDLHGKKITLITEILNQYVVFSLTILILHYYSVFEEENLKDSVDLSDNRKENFRKIFLMNLNTNTSILA